MKRHNDGFLFLYKEPVQLREVGWLEAHANVPLYVFFLLLVGACVTVAL